MGVRALTFTALSVLWMSGGVTQVQAVQAPAFIAGPEVTSGGLLWAGNSSGHENVFLSTATGTRLLVPDADLSEVRVDSDWVVADEASGLTVGRIGQRLTVVQGLRRCLPIQAHTESDRLEAVADGNLYAVVSASCFGRRPGDTELLVSLRLGTGKLHVIGRVPGGVISLAAAGSRLAMTYETGAGRTSETIAGSHVRVEVVDSRNARLLYRLASPPGERGQYRETQLDAKGNVLVTSVGHVLPPGPGVDFGWWGNPGTQVGRPLESENRGFGASLAEGRIAYATSRDGATSIDMLNLATGGASTIVTFSGAVKLEGFGLGGTVVAWAQQSYAYGTLPAGPPLMSCVGKAPVGFTELTETPLTAAGLPIIVNASPGPRPAGQSCPPPPLPPLAGVKRSPSTDLLRRHREPRP
jgi:hypothetical protein